MAVIEGGTSGSLAETGVASAKGLHCILKPQDHGSLGHYAYSATTGTMAAGLAANSDILQFRWGDATRFCIITEVVLQGMYQLTGFTTGAALFRLAIARSFTASGSGGTAATLTGDNQNLRTNMGASLVTDLRISSTAALGAGTKTYDSQDIGTYPKMITAAANTQVFDEYKLFRADIASGEHPIVLAQNEGIGIRATVPATGTWVIGIRLKWAELTAF
jgi:hypothetical protein